MERKGAKRTTSPRVCSSISSAAWLRGACWAAIKVSNGGNSSRWRGWRLDTREWGPSSEDRSGRWKLSSFAGVGDKGVAIDTREVAMHGGFLGFGAQPVKWKEAVEVPSRAPSPRGVP